ncbi:UdgX family uracil-DNA binding protein [Actinomadura nitritigenes]|uniref:Type-4 uracil-DNA glycosylase n=1 Tax=Actinomadura nitritigenes TaxID=134602 RepID=A0ABS3RDZ5_9ACTN|nr:UdgX family uracil-DNA binding protein [Actinomadura nitritigenes]MBO2444449.1 UdgX family uracil-DNA binding protein [Actinomadura nitritigenes]
MNAETSHDAEPYLPASPAERSDLDALRRAAAGCRGCGLYENATQTVFGEGSSGGRVVLIGEQPGDQEDRRGHPFVGPAGRVLDRALEEAGIERGDVYVTNAVKHFKFKRQAGGKRRIHETPNAGEMRACRPWLLAELRTLDPDVVVALGATAGKALLGSSFRVTKLRGRLLALPDLETIGTPAAGRKIDATPPGDADTQVVATIHPSAVLRAEDRDAVYAGLLDDLRIAAQALR